MSLVHRIAAASCLGAPWAFAAAERPNIILMVADDQGWSGLSVEMAPGVAGSRSDAFHTPNLEKLAAQGMRFSNAYAPAPVCSPTRISLQAGRSPAALHWTKAAPPEPGHRLLEPTLVKQVADGEKTIGEVLKKAGYATAHYGKWHIAGGGPGRHGYDEHDGDTGNEHASQFTDPNPVDIFGMADRAEAFMARSHRAGRPFFIQLSWNALHAAENAWCHVPIVGYDVFPTFCEWAGVPRSALPETLEGGSIAAVLAGGGQGRVARPREEMVFHFPHYQSGIAPHSAIRVGKLKLIKFHEDDSVRLFDLEADLGERDDLAARRPDAAAQLRARLERYLVDVRAQLPTVNPHFDPNAAPAAEHGGTRGGKGGSTRGGKKPRTLPKRAA